MIPECTLPSGTQRQWHRFDVSGFCECGKKQTKLTPAHVAAPGQCSICGALPGQPCISSGGHHLPPGRPHSERRGQEIRPPAANNHKVTVKAMAEEVDFPLILEIQPEPPAELPPVKISGASAMALVASLPNFEFSQPERPSPTMADALEAREILTHELSLIDRYVEAAKLLDKIPKHYVGIACGLLNECEARPSIARTKAEVAIAALLFYGDSWCDGVNSVLEEAYPDGHKSDPESDSCDWTFCAAETILGKVSERSWLKLNPKKEPKAKAP